ncbi:MAG: tRNA (adenosine(37)-N6)-dimethylallyltransferase MiaA [Minisyncoccia bacterium]
MNRERIMCVIGPTASGKSARAIALAKEHGSEVISVDSRQVYRTLDIGTEKIGKEEMGGIPHHLIDIREPEECYSAGDFVEDATARIADITARGKLPILAGGTHFYFDALVRGLPSSPKKAIPYMVSPEKTNEELYEEIVCRDPRRAGELDPKNRRRLIRALELIDQYGVVPTREVTPHELKYKVEWVVLSLEKEEIRARIRARLTETLKRGLVEEVRHIRERVGDTRLNELGLEYRVVGEYLRGERDEASLLPALTSKLFQYARRQEAWIRKLTGTP